MLKEFQLDIFGGRKLAGTRPVPTRAELLASAKRDREFEEYIASDELGQFKAREAAAKARHQERLFRRPVEMQSRSYRLPPDVEAFLSRLHNNPLRFASIDGVHGVSADEAAAMIEAAYLRGCTEGYITISMSETRRLWRSTADCERCRYRPAKPSFGWLRNTACPTR